MSQELDPRYDHNAIEDSIYKKWEKSGFFNPDNLPFGKSKEQRAKSKAKKSKKQPAISSTPFAIIMPPPNANGSLHLGHAVFVTLQDLMIRYARMKGKKALWLPGADHAGFETQVVFNKKLEKEGKNWFTMDREALYRAIWEFTQENKKIMEGQLRKLGASCDWSREKFTLDPDIVKIVYNTFERLYKDGLVVRDEALVNWCPKHQTSLSDLEIKDEERAEPFYYFYYGPFTIGTSRPETKFGDKYVVMHPDDPRYKEYKDGEQLHLEWINGPITATILKDNAVDMDFGSGVMTITPWHDPVDFEMASRRGLDKEQVIDEYGKLLPIAGEFTGMKITEARLKIVEKLRSKGLLARIDENYKHVVRTCYKCNTTIEPQIKKQWFVRVNKEVGSGKWEANKSLAGMAIEAAKSGKIKFFPAHAKKIYLHWLLNIRDWNISRQIVWGIRIPAWFCATCSEPKVNITPHAKWFFVRHASTDWNEDVRSIGQADPPLSEQGRAEAKRMAENFKGNNVDLIITSDLKRARQTAEMIAEVTGAEIIVDRKLRERHLGITQGMPKTERNKLYGDLLYSYDGTPPGGESFKDVEERVWTSFKQYRALYRKKNVVIITHGGPIRMILKQIKQWDMTQMLANEAGASGVIQLDVADPCKTCKSDLFEQDPDVFDTWFSSGQWPFATLMTGKKKDLSTFYPTNVMETGHDILFFWVARMIMLGLYRMKEVPFHTVYLHGLVRDKDRQKMSKSKGNVIDPLGMASEYGTDAVRMALTVGNMPGQDSTISEDKIRGYRNFATKVWNIARFVLMHRNETESSKFKVQISKLRPALTATDKKFLKEAKRIKAEVGRHIEKFEFHLAAEKAYHYIWHTFADKIIEHYKPALKVLMPISPSPEPTASQASSPTPIKVSARALQKGIVAQHVLQSILEDSLTMLHPFMPFLTEAIHEKIASEELLIVKQW
ncbi:MAG: class I tRNA ligase family protein [Candidatus Liptonbacteria bacterium]|nr:class I tRNA ligase family protein [Candidatus Liptonbacteria bacterium]